MENIVSMLILASQSTTRKALLQQAGLRFSSVPAAIDERGLEQAVLDAGGDGRDVALLLAEKKAAAVAADHPGAIIIGADQTQVQTLRGRARRCWQAPRKIAIRPVPARLCGWRSGWQGSTWGRCFPHCHPQLKPDL